MKKKISTKILVGITALVIFLLMLYYGEENIIKSFNSEISSRSLELSTKTDELNSARDNLSLISANLQENISEYNELKSGDKYHLHDPIYEELLNFIENDYSSNDREVIDNAKSQGIRCAYVMVYVGGLTISSMDGSVSSSIGGGMHTLVGFNTVDQGMIYFETGTDYQVIPIVGQDYTDCVVGNPYMSGIFDNITDILVIW